jgi:hypothetical protein
MIGQALKQVFGEVRYLLLAAAVALVTFVLTTWLANFALVWQIATSGSVPLAGKVKILTALVGSIGTNFTVVSALSALAIAALFGMNVAVIAYAVRARRFARQSGQGAVGLGGLASGLFGIGCAACGSFALSPALSFLGAGALFALLPFGGEEFSVLGAGLLGLSLVSAARRIAQPAACPVPSETSHRQWHRRATLGDLP